jgi:hypothetical protein
VNTPWKGQASQKPYALIVRESEKRQREAAKLTRRETMLAAAAEKRLRRSATRSIRAPLDGRSVKSANDSTSSVVVRGNADA